MLSTRVTSVRGRDFLDSVLVVEDHRDTRELLTFFLESRGFVVYEAADGLEAIDVAARVHPPIILMDLMMPRLDGWQATRRLKADARTRDITIIAMSALSETRYRQGAQKAGCDGFVRKPYDLNDLAGLLRGILNHRSDSSNGTGTGAVDIWSDDAGARSMTPKLNPEADLLSLDNAIAADISFDNAIAAALERRLRRGQ